MIVPGNDGLAALQDVIPIRVLAAEFPMEGMAYAALAFSTIPKGRIIALDTAAAEAAPGVVLVMTYRNAQRLKAPPASIAVDSSAIDIRVLPRRAPSSCESITAPSGSIMASTARTKRSRTWRARPGSGRARCGGVTMGESRMGQYRTHRIRKSPARRDK